MKGGKYFFVRVYLKIQLWDYFSFEWLNSRVENWYLRMDSKLTALLCFTFLYDAFIMLKRHYKRIYLKNGRTRQWNRSFEE